MITLNIHNSYSKLSNLNVKQFNELRELLSYSINDTAAYFSNAYNKKKYLVDKKGVFPTGLLSIVKKYFINEDILTIDNRIKPASSINFVLSLDVTPYHEQTESVRAIVKNERGTISMPTGTGKSVAMALAIKELGLRTLVIVPNLTLKTQLTDSFIKYFNTLDNITIENIDSPTLENETNYDCLIIDEAHHVAAATYRRLNKIAWKNIYYRLFFTATPFRSKNEEQLLMEGIAGQVIYRLPYKTAIQNKLIVPVEAYYYDLPKTSNDLYTWSQVYDELIVNNSERNKLIFNILLALTRANISTLCLVKEIEHGNILSNNGVFCFAQGANPDNKQIFELFNDRRINALIATTGVAGEGVDTKPTEYVIIAGLGRSKNSFMQQIGRAVRKYQGKDSAKIIIFRDPSHKFTLRHFNEQRKILREEYGVEVVKIPNLYESGDE